MLTLLHSGGVRDQQTPRNTLYSQGNTIISPTGTDTSNFAPPNFISSNVHVKKTYVQHIKTWAKLATFRARQTILELIFSEMCSIASKYQVSSLVQLMGYHLYSYQSRRIYASPRLYLLSDYNSWIHRIPVSSLKLGKYFCTTFIMWPS